MKQHITVAYLIRCIVCYDDKLDVFVALQAFDIYLSIITLMIFKPSVPSLKIKVKPRIAEVTQVTVDRLTPTSCCEANNAAVV